MLSLTLYNNQLPEKKNKIVLIIPPSDKEQRVEIFSNPQNYYRIKVAIEAPKEISIGRENVK